MYISEVMEQVLERKILILAAKVTLDLSILALIFVLLDLIFNTFIGAAGIAILAGYFQSQIPDDPGHVFANTVDAGLGFAIFHWANIALVLDSIFILDVNFHTFLILSIDIDILVHTALNVDPAAEEASGVILGAAKDLSSVPGRSLGICHTEDGATHCPGSTFPRLGCCSPCRR